jgi:hypothetical protein
MCVDPKTSWATETTQAFFRNRADARRWWAFAPSETRDRYRANARGSRAFAPSEPRTHEAFRLLRQGSWSLLVTHI